MRPRRAATLEQFTSSPQNPTPVALAGRGCASPDRAARPAAAGPGDHRLRFNRHRSQCASRDRASPAMVQRRKRPRTLGPSPDALVVNIGTLSTDSVVGMEAAAQVAAKQAGRVLGPVGVARRASATNDAPPAGAQADDRARNASEIIAWARIVGLRDEAAAPEGIDGAHGTEAARASAVALALIIVGRRRPRRGRPRHRRRRVIEMAIGSPLMSKVTALGCALSAISPPSPPARPTLHGDRRRGQPVRRRRRKGRRNGDHARAVSASPSSTRSTPSSRPRSGRAGAR